eukprot:m.18942 g.18942  ORF g.18942 m.18942 type:complete len:181 (-) comp5036_c0_seq1:159-701(-)
MNDPSDENDIDFYLGDPSQTVTMSIDTEVDPEVFSELLGMNELNFFNSFVPNSPQFNIPLNDDNENTNSNDSKSSSSNDANENAEPDKNIHRKKRENQGAGSKQKLSEKEKADQRRERNKLAAQRSRHRKQKRIDDLQKLNQAQQVENSKLQEKTDRLRETIMKLERSLKSHDCKLELEK